MKGKGRKGEKRKTAPEQPLVFEVGRTTSPNSAHGRVYILRAGKLVAKVIGQLEAESAIP